MIIGKPITTLGGGGMTSVIVVTAPTGSTVTLTTPSGIVVTGTEISGTWTFSGLTALGTYTVNASLGSKSKSQSVLIDVAGVYEVGIVYDNYIYLNSILWESNSSDIRKEYELLSQNIASDFTFEMEVSPVNKKYDLSTNSAIGFVNGVQWKDVASTWAEVNAQYGEYYYKPISGEHAIKSITCSLGTYYKIRYNGSSYYLDNTIIGQAPSYSASHTPSFRLIMQVYWRIKYAKLATDGVNIDHYWRAVRRIDDSAYGILDTYTGTFITDSHFKA